MNNYYQNPYGAYPQQYVSPAVPQVQNVNRQSIIWVNGEEGARAYQLAPNSSAMLLDAENEGRFYIKTTDNIGMCTIRVFDYKEIIDVTPPSMPTQDMSMYATRQELQELKDMINSLKGGRHEQSIQSAQYRAKNVPANSTRE